MWGEATEEFSGSDHIRRQLEILNILNLFSGQLSSLSSGNFIDKERPALLLNENSEKNYRRKSMTLGAHLP